MMAEPGRAVRPGSSRSASAAAGTPAPASPRPASITPASPQSRFPRPPPSQQQYAESSAATQHPAHQPQPLEPLPSSHAPPPPPFRPLYTLLTTTTARGTSTHHPRVHYIFSDDDPDELTQALALHHVSLAPDAAEDDPSPAGSGYGAGSSHSGDGRQQQQQPKHHPQPAGPGPRDHAVVLDLVPRADGGVGYEVASASSLSADWAVVGARVTRMEAEDNSGSTTGAAAGTTGALSAAAAGDRLDSPGAGLMLRIEGVGADFGVASALPAPGAGAEGGGEMHTSSTSGSGRRLGLQPSEDYGALIEEFDRRMGVLTRVVDAAEEWEQRMAQEAELEAHEAEARERTEAGTGQSMAPAQDKEAKEDVADPVPAGDG